MARVYEIPERELANRITMFNQQVRDDMARVVTAVGINGEAPSPIEEGAIANNAITLPRGDNYGCHLRVEDTVVRGLSAGCYMTRKATLEADAVFEGIHFVSNDSNVNTLIDVRGTAAAVFRNCTFEKRAQDTVIYITVANGAKALLVGCVFKGDTSAAGNLFDHAGAAANVQVVGCYNKTTHGLGTVTTTASI